MIPIFSEPSNHTTYRNTSGVVVPSVTSIIHMINKPELVHWANSLGFKRKSVSKELDVSAYIGDITHKLVEIYTTTGKYSYDIIDRKGPVERLGIKNAFLSFLQMYKTEHPHIEIHDTEVQLAGEKFGGTTDLLAKYHGKFTIGDYKTSKGFYPTMFLQIAGYDLLLRELGLFKAEQYVVFLLDKRDGRPAKIKICDDKDQMQLYRKCFKTLVDFYYDWYMINQRYWGKDLLVK